ncbi:MAG: hypothetical protein ABII72_02980 [Parcubacteria group bacterium]
MNQGTESKSGGEDAAAELERATEQAANIDSMPAAEPRTPAGEQITQSPKRSRFKKAVSGLVAGLAFLGAVKGAEADYTTHTPAKGGRDKNIEPIKTKGLKGLDLSKKESARGIGSLLQYYNIKHDQLKDDPDKRKELGELKISVEKAIADAKALAKKLKVKAETIFDFAVAKKYDIDVAQVPPTPEPPAPVKPPESKLSPAEAARLAAKALDSDTPADDQSDDKESKGEARIEEQYPELAGLGQKQDPEDPLKKSK